VRYAMGVNNFVRGVCRDCDASRILSLSDEARGCYRIRQRIPLYAFAAAKSPIVPPTVYHSPRAYARLPMNISSYRKTSVETFENLGRCSTAPVPSISILTNFRPEVEAK
jgi:hypothetical protein